LLAGVGGAECSKAQSKTQLIRQYQEQRAFWQQFDIAKALVSSGDRGGLPAPEHYLNDEERHARANAA
jgi:hypothetical protein